MHVTRGRTRRRGQAIVEFALSSVILVTLFTAIFEFSWVFYNYAYLNNALNKAGRLAIVGGTNQQVTDEVTGAAGGLPIGAPTISVCTPAGEPKLSTDRTPGDWITITATIDYPNLTPLSQLVRMSPIGSLTSSCTLRIE